MSTVRFTSNVGDVAKTLDDNGEKLLEALARDTQGEVSKILRRGGRTGNLYKVPGTDRDYRASAPGEPPAPRTGDLANSYHTRMEGSTASEVYSELPQAVLEFGTDTIEPRPHLRPAMQSTGGRITRIVKRVYT